MTGQQALRAVEQAALQLRADEAKLQQALRASEEEAARLRSERLGALRDLAAVKLDTMKREAVVSSLSATERKALQAIAERRLAVEDLAARVDRAREEVGAKQTQRHAILSAITALTEKLEALQADAEPKIRATTDWLAQKEALDTAESIAQAAEAKASSSEADLAGKRGPYEADPLFIYLKDRGFGTPGYRAGPLTAFLDRKVALLVGFDKARANYAMLTEIPVRLREHANRCREGVQTLRDRLVAIEQAGLRQAGSGPLEADLESERKRLAEADEALAKAEAELARAEQDRQTALPAEEDAYRAAVEMIAQADMRQDVQTLYGAAVRTSTPEDDAIVRTVERIDKVLSENEVRQRDLRGRLQSLEIRRQEVEQQRDAIRRQGWDNPLGQYGNDRALNDVLGSILQGAVQGAVLGSVLKDGYSRRAPRADSSFGGNGGFTLPPMGGGWGGGLSGGGWPGGGGGDGFRTGGSF